MSIFAHKLFKGERPSDDDWNEHLVEAHRIEPGMTPDAFNPFKDARGLNSYAILAQSLGSLSGRDAAVLDLACGDGHLIPYLLGRLGSGARVMGVDMSEGELNVARRNIKDPRVTFHHARAQELPFPDSSIDHVVCHMAFMLMLPVEPVVRELARVLKPGAKFSAVTGGPVASGLYREIRKAKSEFVIRQFPSLAGTRTGDPRVKSRDGLGELFNPQTGFQSVEGPQGFELNIHTDPEGIWYFERNTYIAAILPEPAKQELKELLTGLGRSAADGDGKVSFQFPMQIFSTVKA